MNYITLGIVGLSVFFLGTGALYGMSRGLKRSSVRLSLVLISIVLAVLLRKTFVNIFMDISIGGETLNEVLVSALNEGEALPPSMQNLVFALVEILIGLVAYFVIFAAINLLTLIIVFPILKIFIKKEEPKRKGFGAIVGLVQGAILAFAFCSPVTGLIIQVDKLSQVKMDGETLIEIPAEIGIEDYVKSFPCKVYDKTGGWFFDLLTTTKTDDGTKVSIEDTVDVVLTVTDIANTATELSDSIDLMTNATTPQEQILAMKNLGDSLIEIGNSIDSLSDDAKEMVNGLIDSVKDMLSKEGETDPALEEALANFDINSIDLSGAGSAMKGIATYIEKTNPEFANNTPVTQEDVNLIVNGLAENNFVLAMISGGEETPVLIDATEHSDMFISAIEATSIPAEDKDVLKAIFGLN